MMMYSGGNRVDWRLRGLGRSGPDHGLGCTGVGLGDLARTLLLPGRGGLQQRLQLVHHVLQPLPLLLLGPEHSLNRPKLLLERVGKLLPLLRLLPRPIHLCVCARQRLFERCQRGRELRARWTRVGPGEKKKKRPESAIPPYASGCKHQSTSHG